MPKSYFRRPDESGSESSSSEEEEEETTSLSRDLSQVDLSHSRSADSITFDRTQRGELGALGRDLLIHALLEERCLNQARRDLTGRSENEVHLEAQRRYHAMCQHLAPLNLFSAGLEGSEHSANRQWVRDGLDRLSLGDNATSRALQRGQRPPAVSGPLRRYLTEGDVSPFPNPSALDIPAQLSPAKGPTRYIRDFKHIALLGKGGYGEVYQAQHHVDGQVYAVKKVPIHPGMIRRAQSEGAEGEAAIDEVLKEVRSLSRLSHPNIVRYNNSWIEESYSTDILSPSSDATPDAVLGAMPSASFNPPSLHRVKTESDDIGISFESRSREVTEEKLSNNNLLANADSRADDSYLSFTESESGKGRQISIPGPALALYLQMAVYPMTLADFISPKAPGDIKPLAHCFHLEPSVRILLAILEGVEYMHAQNVVHRDIKPANVFLKLEDSPRANPTCVDLSSCADCQAQKSAEPVNLGVCIGDFGLVTSIAHASQMNEAPKSSAVGTEIYRPTASKDNISPRLDIFAVGIIACELMCKFDTQMERRQTLHDLRQGRFPKNFGTSAGRHGHSPSKLRDCVASMLSDTDETSIAELKEMLSSLLATKEKEKDSGTRIVGREDVLRRSST